MYLQLFVTQVLHLCSPFTYSSAQDSQSRGADERQEENSGQGKCNDFTHRHGPRCSQPSQSEMGQVVASAPLHGMLLLPVDEVGMVSPLLVQQPTRPLLCDFQRTNTAHFMGIQLSKPTCTSVCMCSACAVHVCEYLHSHGESLSKNA